MRVLALLMVASGCYQPQPYPECSIKCDSTIASSCPDDLVCIQRRCRESEAVACPTDIPDSSPGCDIPSAWGPNTSFGVLAFAGRGSYTTDLTQTFAALDVQRDGTTGEHDVKTGTDGTMLTTIVVADVLPVLHFTPRLSPEGLEMFMQERMQGMVPAKFLLYARADRDAAFSPAGDVLIFKDDVQEMLTQNDLPGTPTVVSEIYPRRMMIKKGSELWEVQQSKSDAARWDFVESYTAADFGLAAIRDPQLSADGLRLMFTGSTTGGNPFEVYGAMRTSLRDRFIDAKHVLAAEIAFPFLSPDCRTLYGRSVGSGQVGHRSAM